MVGGGGGGGGEDAADPPVGLRGGAAELALFLTLPLGADEAVGGVVG